MTLRVPCPYVVGENTNAAVSVGRGCESRTAFLPVGDEHVPAWGGLGDVVLVCMRLR